MAPAENSTCVAAHENALAFLRGHDETPVSAPTKINGQYCTGGKPHRIAGKPNFHVIAGPSPDLVEELVRAYKESSLTRSA